MLWGTNITPLGVEFFIAFSIAMAIDTTTVAAILRTFRAAFWNSPLLPLIIMAFTPLPLKGFLFLQD